MTNAMIIRTALWQDEHFQGTEGKLMDVKGSGMVNTASIFVDGAGHVVATEWDRVEPKIVTREFEVTRTRTITESCWVSVTLNADESDDDDFEEDAREIADRYRNDEWEIIDDGEVAAYEYDVELINTKEIN